jgi:ArsR family transcriptional regulator
MRDHPPSAYRKTARLLKAAAHPVRLAILELLGEYGEECVCHMEAALGYRQAYLSQHLMALREAGLVEDRREGRNIFYRVIRPELAVHFRDMRETFGPPEPQRRASSAACACPKCAREEPLDLAQKA